MLNQFMQEWFVGSMWLGSSLLLCQVFYKVLFPELRAWVKKSKTDYDDILLEAIEWPLYISILITGVFSFITNTPCKWLTGDTSLMSIRLTLFWVMFYWLGYRILSGLENEIVSNIRALREAHGLAQVIRIILKVIVVLCAGITITHVWQQNIWGIVTAFGFGGAVIAFASKDVIGNIFSGFVLLVDKPFKVNDFISIGETEGYVRSMSLRSTQLETFDRAFIFIPNSVVANSYVLNNSHAKRKNRRIRFRISLPHGTSTEEIRDLIFRIEQLFIFMSRHNYLDSEYSVTLDKLGSSCYEVLVICYTNNIEYLKFLKMRNNVNFGIVEILDKVGMQLAAFKISIIEEE
ncbi:MAG: mechanosensitive ion channel family protein [Lachnospiraceae bacterium]|nr:mechanosensitive ion channel family protein [Lachnospiraceae bacterium]